MSDLEALCDALGAINGDILQRAQELHATAQAYNRSAASAAAAARSAKGEQAAALARVAAAFNAAAQHCGRAAQLLVGASSEGQAFVRRTVGGSAGVRGKGSGDVGDADLRSISTQSGSASFSSDTVASCWAQGSATGAGRAYYENSDRGMRKAAAALKPFPGEYTVDMHGTPSSVSVGNRSLDAKQVAELIRADSSWGGRPVRLFSCNTGYGTQPIAQLLAKELSVRVTAPKALAWSDAAGHSWVAGYEWKLVGGTLQRVSTAPQADGWQTFDP